LSDRTRRGVEGKSWQRALSARAVCWLAGELDQTAAGVSPWLPAIRILALKIPEKPKFKTKIQGAAVRRRLYTIRSGILTCNGLIG